MLKESDHLEGTTIVVTGSLDNMSRGEAEEKIHINGGKAASSISGNTDYLIVGNNAGSNKMKETEKHNVEKINENRFLKLIGK